MGGVESSPVLVLHILTVLPRLAVDEIFITGIEVAEETGTGSELGS
jgi:hypothetical protein